MLNKPEDIEIFILTYNRSEMLEQTIISILNQTTQGFNITVLDNGSTDNTPEITKKYNINTHRNETNLGQEANFLTAQKLASKKWVMLFHDDDLMHPRYIEEALIHLNTHPNTVLLGSGYVAEYEPTNTNWNYITNNNYHCHNSSDFALMLFLDHPYHFASSIYKTELFKKYSFRYDIYGKICDRPFLLDIASNGEVGVLDSNFIKYRVHPGQDSLTPSTGPYLINWLALHENYHKFITKDCTCFKYLLYNIRALDFLRAGYDWLKNEHSTTSKKLFIKMAKDRDIIPLGAFAYTFCLNNKISRGLFRKIGRKLIGKFFDSIRI